MRERNTGFTLVELMIVVAVIAILALVAMPNMQSKFVRDQIVEAMHLADLAKAPVAASWAATQTFPIDNAGAGLPPANKIVSNFISAVTVEAGAIHVSFGNSANAAIQGKILTLRPAVVDDTPIVPVAWVCGSAAVPGKMSLHGTDRTSVPKQYLPLNCR